MSPENLNGSRATILCVDDEPAVLSSIARMLRDERYELLSAGSGKAGLEVLEQGEVDVVISDMRMPEMNGTEFLTQVATRWPDTVRIVLTGYSDMDETVAAINHANIFRYVAKPWVNDEFRKMIRDALHHIYEQQVARAALTRANATLRELIG